MNPIKFRGYNCTFAESQEEYLSLPAHKHNDEFGTVTSCWGLTFWERLRVLVTGRIYSNLLTFDKPLAPQLLEARSPVENGVRSRSPLWCYLMSKLDFRFWFCECHYQPPYGKVIMGGCSKHDYE